MALDIPKPLNAPRKAWRGGIAPTRENPAIDIPVGPMRVMRGYEVANDRGDQDFVGSHDGPLLQIRMPNQTILMTVDAAAELATALMAAVSVPKAEPGAHDEELLRMGFRPLWRS